MEALRISPSLALLWRDGYGQAIKLPAEIHIHAGSRQRHSTLEAAGAAGIMQPEPIPVPSDCNHRSQCLRSRATLLTNNPHCLYAYVKYALVACPMQAPAYLSRTGLAQQTIASAHLQVSRQWRLWACPLFQQHTARECSSNADRTHSLSSPRGRGWPGGCKHARWCAPCGGCRCSGAAPVAAAACAAAAQLRMQSPGPTGRGCPAAAPVAIALSGCPLTPVMRTTASFSELNLTCLGHFCLTIAWI